MAKPTDKNVLSSDYIRMYYEHQYDRLAKLEEQAMVISNFVITLTIVAFTFGFSNTQIKLIPSIGLSVVVVLSNIFAVFYIKRTSSWSKYHRERAKEVLKNYMGELYALDKSKPEPKGLGRRKIQRNIHIILAIASALVPLALYL